jgi:hypothetical protein
LLNRRKPAAADSLEHPKDNQHRKAGGRAAQKRRCGKERNVHHVVALAAEHGA